MFLKSILKAISLLSFTIFVSTETIKSDCDEINSYVNGRNFETRNIITCIENELGEVTSLRILNRELNTEDLDKLFSYNTITTLDYAFLESYVNVTKPGYQGFPPSIAKLTNLKELTLRSTKYEKPSAHSPYKYRTPYTYQTIDKNVLKLNEDLKKLQLFYIDLSQDNINEIANLKNLEELKFSDCKFSDNLKLNGLKTLEKLKTISINYLEWNNSLRRSFLTYLKSATDLTLMGVNITQANLNEITKLSNLERITIDESLFDGELNKYSFGGFKNLTELTIGYERYLYPHNKTERQITLLVPNSLKKLHLESIYLSRDNVYKITSALNLEELTLKNCDYSSGISFSNFKKLPYFTTFNIQNSFNTNIEMVNFINMKYLQTINLENVEFTKLHIYQISKLTKLNTLKIKGALKADNIINYDDFKRLSNLTSLSLIYNDNTVEEIPKSILSLTKLKELTLSLSLTKIPTTISKLTNLEILDLSNNKITNLPSELGNLLELKNLDLSYNKIINLPSELGNLLELENLNLKSNALNDEIPTSLNYLKNLKTISFESNKDLKGKTLTNESLEKCEYDAKSSVCKVKDMPCLEKQTAIKGCTPRKISMDGRCGGENGICREGYCCSKLGWCGNSELHCKISNGCQSEFGHCY